MSWGLMQGISSPALFMNGEWCINSLNMYMYITQERACPIVCRIDSGVSYKSLGQIFMKKRKEIEDQIT